MYQEVIKDLEERSKKTIASLKNELMNIRAGRANPQLVENIQVLYYGSMTPLKQVASISAPEARLLVIQPWDAKVLSEIEKAILKSDLGITPSNDGKIIRLPFPILTEDRRKELIKVAKKEGENSKIAVRNLRKDAIDEIKRMEKEESLPEDDRKNAESEIQEVVDKYNELIDDTIKEKKKNLWSFSEVEIFSTSGLFSLFWRNYD